jgi:hypothetical protein
MDQDERRGQIGTWLRRAWNAAVRTAEAIDPLIALDLKATLERAGVIVLGPAGRVSDAMLLAGKSLPVAAVLDVRLEVGTSCLSQNGLPNGTFRFCFRQAIRFSSMPHIRPLLCCANRSGPSS